MKIAGKHISLETYRRNGTPVRTPVWFAEADGMVYVFTLVDTGKVKRIRANPRARVAACDMRGNLSGEWMDAEARIVEGDEAQRGQDALRKKYGLWKSISDFFGRLRGRRQAILAIRLLTTNP